MYIPALDVIRGLPEVDIEAEMEDVAEMQYSVQRAKDTHLRRTFNQYRLSELSAVVFTNGERKQYPDVDLEYEVGSLYLRYGHGYEALVASTPNDTGTISSSFPDFYGDDEYEDNSTSLTEKSWELLAEVVEWGNAQDDSVPCPVEPEDIPVCDRWFVFNGLIMTAYGPNKCPPEARIILGMAQYKAGNQEDCQLRDL